MLKLFSHYADNEIIYVQKYNKIRIKARKYTDKIIILAVFSFLSARIVRLFYPYCFPLSPVYTCF